MDSVSNHLHNPKSLHREIKSTFMSTLIVCQFIWKLINRALDYAFFSEINNKLNDYTCTEVGTVFKDLCKYSTCIHDKNNVSPIVDYIFEPVSSY